MIKHITIKRIEYFEKEKVKFEKNEVEFPKMK